MKARIGGCTGCICQSCLKYMQGKCPYGGCCDGLRAEREPEYRCRGGIFYTADTCDEFIKFIGAENKYCLDSAITIFQDGSIICSLIENVGCEECYRQFEDQHQEECEEL